MKRMYCMLLTLCLALAIATPAMAEIPREIHPLAYDSLPAALEGQHHYLLACVDTWETKPTNLGNTDGGNAGDLRYPRQALAVYHLYA